MKLLIKACSFETMEFIKEVTKEIKGIDIFFGKSEQESECEVYLVCEKKEMSGFYLKKKNGEVKIEYQKLVDLGRALLQLFTSQKKDIIEMRQKSSVQELGVMLDCSRNAVPRITLLKKMIRIAALLGYDFLGLYIEDTIQIQEEPYYGYMRGAFSKEELQEIDAYGQKIGVEIRPYLETLAHINQITRYTEYEPIIDTDDILLVGNERTYKLIRSLIATVASCLHTKIINIGMDEAHMLGLGKYLDQNGYEKRSDIMLKHLHKVLNICREYGLHVQMWSDMFFNLPYIGSSNVKKNQMQPIEIPEDVELVYWDYYSTEKKHYDEMFEKHAKLLKKENNFAGGAWKWTGYAPSNHFSILAGKAAIASAIEHGVKSCVITGWGDNGADASHLSNLPCLFADSEFVYKGEIDTELFRTLTGMSYEEYLLIDAPRYFEQDDVHSNPEKFLLYNDPLYGTFDSVIPENISEFYKEKSEELNGVLEKAGEYRYVFETLQKLCDVLIQKADLGKQIRKAYQKKDKKKLEQIVETISEVITMLNIFESALEKQWRKENKPFGFEVQTIRLGGLHHRLCYTQNLLKEYLTGKLDCIEELEVKQLPMGMDTQQDSAKLDYNLWANIVSPSVI